MKIDFKTALVCLNSPDRLSHAASHSHAFLSISSGLIVH